MNNDEKHVGSMMVLNVFQPQSVLRISTTRGFVALPIFSHPQDSYGSPKDRENELHREIFGNWRLSLNVLDLTLCALSSLTLTLHFLRFTII